MYTSSLCFSLILARYILHYLNCNIISYYNRCKACKAFIIHILIAKFNFIVAYSSFIIYINILETQLRLKIIYITSMCRFIIYIISKCRFLEMLFSFSVIIIKLFFNFITKKLYIPFFLSMKTCNH